MLCVYVFARWVCLLFATLCIIVSVVCVSHAVFDCVLSGQGGSIHGNVHEHLQHRYNSVFLVNHGAVTAFGPEGKRLWQTLTTSTWSHDDSVCRAVGQYTSTSLCFRLSQIQPTVHLLPVPVTSTFCFFLLPALSSYLSLFIYAASYLSNHLLICDGRTLAETVSMPTHRLFVSFPSCHL